jgi:uncharacterized protein (DUF362 family)/Pyruvate/2-oxoacid:ferredoxin oxidoreductase delta subunit
MKINADVAVLACPGYQAHDVEVKIRKLFELLGQKEFPSQLLLKPNMLSARLPEEAVTTHPVILAALGKIIPGRLYAGDCPPSAGKNPGKYWETCGYRDIADSAGIKLVTLEGESTIRTITVSRKNASFPVSNVVLNLPVLNLPKLKTHNVTVLTAAMKNTYGFIPGYPKSLLHAKFPEPESFNAFLVEFYRAVRDRIFFNLVDAVEIMEGNGPAHGIKRQFGYLIAGKDALTVDVVCARLLGFDINDIPFLRIYKEKYGIPDFRILGDNPEPLENFNSPPASLLIKTLRNPLLAGLLSILGKRFAIIPVLEEAKCKKCMACIRVCPQKAISDDLKINRKKCINCLCCYEVCPEGAIKAVKSKIAKFFV